MDTKKKIALVAHDNKKAELLEWAEFNRDLLAGHFLFATEATGAALRDLLGLDVTILQSGPLGGDQQIGAGICEGKIDIVLFSGILWRHSHMIPTSGRWCVSPQFGTSRSHLTGPRPTS